MTEVKARPGVRLSSPASTPRVLTMAGIALEPKTDTLVSRRGCV